MFNSEIYYPWRFSFVPVHYYAAILFTVSLAFHVAVKFSVIREAFHERGVLKPLRETLAETVPEPPGHDTSAPVAPAAPTISRRGFVGTVGAASIAVGVSAAGQSIGGPLRELAIFTPRSRVPARGPNGFQVNKTASAVGITADETGASWTLRVIGPDGRSRALSRAEAARAPPGDRGPADRLRRRLVDDAAVDRRPPTCAGRIGRCRAGEPARRSNRSSGQANSGRRRSRQTRPPTPARCWRFGSTGSTSRSTTGFPPGSSSPRCRGSTARSGSRALDFTAA